MSILSRNLPIKITIAAIYNLRQMTHFNASGGSPLDVTDE
jgi:hypothetical protein